MFGVDNPSWIFIILGIVVALNSGEIDKAVQSNKKIKKLMVVICCSLTYFSQCIYSDKCMYID